ncbi:unnamed protein product [Owenia fusiformis]|uniref:Uncharacterized protein n=1 Tax=Owenia fusiformis TaxID=6347 RepID=A0A8J1T7Y0_OWEFU|nr:unnamed protein product [Owenia fusiformis]
MTSMFGIDKHEVVRMKVKKCDGLVQPEYKKLCVDPQITSFEVLLHLLATAFKIKGDFTVSYLSRDEYNRECYLSLLSDWDLDAAFMSASDPLLRLKVDLKPFEEGLDDWDIVAPGDIGTNRLSQLVEKSSLLGSITASVSSQMGKTVSTVQQALGMKVEPSEVMKPLKLPMTDAEFHNFMDAVGHLVQPQAFRLSVYQGGVEPSLRKVVWRHLLNIYPEGMNGRERFDYLKSKSQEYFRLRDEWHKKLQSSEQSEEMRFVTSMVKKDVLRTDRTHKFYAGSDENKNIVSLFNILVTYAMTHPDVSYCQGMSDIASPILVIQKDEAHAYICFCGIMKRVKTNFMLDGHVMSIKFQHLSLLLQHNDPEFFAYLQQQDASDMFFCYRWLLLEMKREFPFDDALHMLEVMWSSLPPDLPASSGLELSDPNYNIIQYSMSPSSPTPTNKTSAYERLRSLKRGYSPKTKDISPKPRVVQSGTKSLTTVGFKVNSNTGKDGKNSMNDTITPLEEEKLLVDAKDFESIEDSVTQSLSEKSSSIDRSFGSDGTYSENMKPSLESIHKIEEDITTIEEDIPTMEEDIPAIEEDTNRGEEGNQNSNAVENSITVNAGKLDGAVQKRLAESQKQDYDKKATQIFNELKHNPNGPRQNCVGTTQKRDEITQNSKPERHSEFYVSLDEDSSGPLDNERIRHCSKVSDSSSGTGQSHFYVSLDSTGDHATGSSTKRPNDIPIINVHQTEDDFSGNSTESTIRHGNTEVHTDSGYTDSSCEVAASDSATNSSDIAQDSLSMEYTKFTQELPPLPAPDEFGQGNPFLIFLCLTLLLQHRDHIIHNDMDYNDLAMHFDKMVRKHNMPRVLRQAQSLYAAYLQSQARLAAENRESTEYGSI